MTLRETVERLHLSVRCSEDQLDRVVTGVYAGDLMSDVIANASAGNVWITMQVHLNIVAVAVIKELAGIIIVQGRQPAGDTLKKATDEHVMIAVSELPAFDVAGRLYADMFSGS